MSLRIAMIGQTGQLARAILGVGAALDHQVTAFDRTALDLSTDAADIETTLFEVLFGFDVLLLAAAYTDVDGAETDSETAQAINAMAPGAIARACARRSLPLIHISTDYVFDGQSKKPYKPDDKTQPLSVYGASKLAGETAVLVTHTKALILRTSWIFDYCGRNFLTTMLRLAESRDTVSVVSDQIGRPTFAGDLACAILRAAEVFVQDKQSTARIYHVTNGGEPISWAEFASEIFQITGKDVDVYPIPSSDYPTSAKRPAYSVLCTQSFEQDFEYALPDWREGLIKALDV